MDSKLKGIIIWKQRRSFSFHLKHEAVRIADSHVVLDLDALEMLDEAPLHVARVGSLYSRVLQRLWQGGVRVWCRDLYSDNKTWKMPIYGILIWAHTTKQIMEQDFLERRWIENTIEEKQIENNNVCSYILVFYVEKNEEA